MTSKLLENTRRWRKTKRGVVTNIYSKMKERNDVDFDLEWLHEFAKLKKFDRLFLEWEKSGYNKQFKPTIDRILRSKGYTKKNIQWLSWAENRYKQTMERRSRKGPVLQMMGSLIIAKYGSQRLAVKATGISQSNISECLNGKRKTAGGYSWIYEHQELLEEGNDE
jgi:hypothetical protein